MVLAIDGIDVVLGALEVLEYIKIGQTGLEIGDDWTIGGLGAAENQRDILSVEGSTTSITQQLLQEKGGTGSVSSVRIAAIDKDGYMTELISRPTQPLEILGRQATLYLGFNNTAYPDDFIEVFKGIIDDIEAGAGKVTLNLAHPDQKKRQEIFRQVKTTLDGAVLAADTTLVLASTANLLSPPPVDTSLTCFVRIGDELIRYTGISDNELTGCTRGQLGTTAADHDDGAEVTSFYRLQGSMVDLALKLMMSQETPTAYANNVAVESFVAAGASGTNDNWVFFKNIDLVARYNVRAGDTLSTVFATSNNIFRVIEEIEVTDEGTIVTVAGAALVLETDSPGIASFISKYDVLGVGLGMKPNEVDIDEHLALEERFSASFPDYDFYIKDTINGRDFIHEQLYFPAACYMLPRKGRASIGFTSPPLAIDVLKFVDSDNVKNPGSLKVRRTTAKHFYNTVVYKYDEDPLEDKFRAGTITLDATSRQTIGTDSDFVVEARGLRQSSETNTLISLNSRRFLDRYKNAAESIENIQMFFGDGFDTEAGDVVAFGDNALKLSDTTRGDRAWDVRLMEIANKKLDIKSGTVTLTIIDTNYASDARYGVISPSSRVAAGSSTTTVKLESAAYGLGNLTREREKWEDYIGEAIIVRSEDWATVYETTLVGFHASDPLLMEVEDMGGTPVAGMVVDIPPYPDGTEKAENAVYKVIHAFLTPRVQVASGIDDLEFEVDPADASKFLVGATIIVHTDDWSEFSPEVTVEEVDGTTITCESSLGFSPDSTHYVDLIGFPDGGQPYRIL
jgi:hypothetical protein